MERCHVPVSDHHAPPSLMGPDSDRADYGSLSRSATSTGTAGSCRRSTERPPREAMGSRPGAMGSRRVAVRLQPVADRRRTQPPWNVPDALAAEQQPARLRERAVTAETE